MSCNYPLRAYRRPIWHKGKIISHEIVFDERKAGGDGVPLNLPCGQCDGCKLERARQWAVRCMHEAKMHDRNCFITLTYNDEHLPDRNELQYSDFQKFMKRLRMHHTYRLRRKRKGVPFLGPVGSRPIRFFMCGEYGEHKTNRPHFHACIFGIDFDDRIYFKTSAAGSKVYTSSTLQSLWSDRKGNPYGYATVGNVDFDSAGYVARYTLKKNYGRSSDLDYEEIDFETGEVYLREREFTRMSLKRGIGADFYTKWKSDIYPHDHVIVKGKRTKPPRYYAKMLKQESALLYEELQYNRHIEALKHQDDMTPERLEAKERVLKARISFLKRELK